MRPGSGVGLLAASLAFAGATGLGSAVAVRDQLPGRPFGISVPLSVPAGLLAGWGAGVAAPWPMPVAAVIAAARARRAAASGPAGAVCAGIGLGCIVGTLIEPVSWRPRSWTRWTRLAIAGNMAASAALTVSGWRHLIAARLVEPGPRRLAGCSVPNWPAEHRHVPAARRARGQATVRARW